MELEVRRHHCPISVEGIESQTSHPKSSFVKIYTHMSYAMVVDITYDWTFDMYYLRCKGILHDRVVCFLTMWYALFDYVVCLFQNHMQNTSIYDI